MGKLLAFTGLFGRVDAVRPKSAPDRVVGKGGLIEEYLAALFASERLGREVVHHRILPPAEARYGENNPPLGAPIRELLAGKGVKRLFSHQTEAADRIRQGLHTVTATPTASGKSLVYNLPVLERFLADRETRALYLFPLKALARDQVRSLERFVRFWPEEARPRIAMYDGDVGDGERAVIRRDPPNILVLNPEMLHLAILTFHDKWASFLQRLDFVVVDEVHAYRGVLGSHMAGVFRRLNRIANFYGADPTYIFSSATIGNPAELATALSDREVQPILESGAPRAARRFVFMNPERSPASTVVDLLRSALKRNLRTIVYAASRKMTELLCHWTARSLAEYSGRISAYRAGFLPEERREIEAKMASGELLCVISTSALELGIDVGELDLCILVGYPGTITAAMQRGGRVGRAGRDSAVILVAGEDALDQYFMRKPDEFFDRPPEAAVINPDNPVILDRHLECAAAELPLDPREPWFQRPAIAARLARLETDGLLLRDREGKKLHAARSRPQRDLDLRGAGFTLSILDAARGTIIGGVDYARSLKETHEGAIYWHRGRQYVVEKLDFDRRLVFARQGDFDWFTRPRSVKSTEILDVLAERTVLGTTIRYGRLRVTEKVEGYEKRAVRGQRLIEVVPLDLPELIFETEGLWFEVPLSTQDACQAAFLHFMGGIHALEHAAIAVCPLLVMADRDDLGGISTPLHPQVGTPAVFIYDGRAGGVGLTRVAFDKAEALFHRTSELIAACDCESGCPSCVHSPKCGSGNRPIDKAAAQFVLDQLLSRPVGNAPPRAESPPAPSRVVAKPAPAGLALPAETPPPKKKNPPVRFGVLDVETRRSAAEVGGWNRADRMGVSVAVLYDSGADDFLTFQEHELDRLFHSLRSLELVVGFNSVRFDYAVLQPFAPYSLRDLPSFDILLDVQKRLNYRLPLDNIAKATVNAPKSADGLTALQWWKEGKIEEIARYCVDDVRITRDVYLYGRENGHILFTNKAKALVKLPVDWP